MQKLRNNFSIKIYFVKENYGLVSTNFTLEQKYGFKLERNKDLTFIVIIINTDWYEKKYCDNFLAISPSLEIQDQDKLVR